MTDSHEEATRRTVLKSSLGAAGATLLTGLAAAEDGGDTVHVAENVARAGEPTEAIVLLADAPATIAASVEEQSRTAIKTQVQERQAETIATLSELDGVTVENAFWVTNSLLVSVDPSRVDVEGELASTPGVSGVYENQRVEAPEPVEEQLTASPADQHTDTETVTTYGLEQINVPAARSEFGARGDGVGVGVVDSGLDASHPAHDEFDPDNFAEFTLGGDRVDTDPRDRDGHGTHVSGTAVGDAAEDGQGVVQDIGVAPDAELYNALSLKPFDGGQASGTTAQIVAGIDYVVEEGADVVNLSLGGAAGTDLHLKTMRRILGMGVLPVAAAGNDGPGVTSSPGDVRETVSVGATNRAGEVTGFSSGEQILSESRWGSDRPDDYPAFYTVPDVAAPGDGVLSSYLGGSYAELSGTSMASPHVAGAAALVLSENPDLSPTEVADLLDRTAVHPDGPDAEDTRYGTGIVDVLAALTAAGDGQAVTGTVTDGDGEPVTGVQVVSDYGTQAFTGPEGGYEIVLPPGESTLTFGKFGVVSAQETVEGSGADVTLDRTVDVQFLSNQFTAGQRVQRAEIAVSLLTRYANEDGLIDFDGVLELVEDNNQGEVDFETVLRGIELYNSETPVEGQTFSIPLEVGNLETLTIELADATTGIDPEGITFAVGGTTFGVGESVSLGGFTGSVALTVQLGANVLTGESGELALEHTFAGEGEQQSVRTPLEGTTTVLRGTPATFEIVDATLPETAEPGFTVGATIENTGDAEATKPVTYFIGGTPVPLGGRTVPAGETAEITLPLNFSALVSLFGGATVPQRFTTPDDEVSGQVSIPAGGSSAPAFEINGVVAPSSVQSGQSLEITTTVENVGTTGASLVQVVLDTDRPNAGAAPKLLDFRAPIVGEGETGLVDFEIETSGLDPGEYTYQVVTSADSVVRTLRVDPAE